MTRKRKWLAGAGVLVVIVTLAVFLLRWQIVDYGSGAEGLVVDSSGTPIPDATVTVTFDRTVFEAVTPLRAAQVTTDRRGRFRQIFISCGEPGGAYTITVEKSGFQRARIRGEGLGAHRIVLQREAKANAGVALRKSGNDDGSNVTAFVVAHVGQKVTTFTVSTNPVFKM